MEADNVYQLSINYFGKDYIVNVDSIELANSLLNDPEAAENFLRIHQPEIFGETNTQAFATAESFWYAKNDSCPSKSTAEEAPMDLPCETTKPPEQPPIWTKRKPTPEDIDATYMLLKVRKEMSKEFDDKKSVKAKLWQKIANEINKSFNLGDNGGERCRQKMSNLIKPYLAYINNQKTTGSKNIDVPPFYNEIHAILGSKDKVQPKRLEDSLVPSFSTPGTKSNQSTVASTSEESTSDQTPKRKDNASEEDISDEVENRFKIRNKRMRPLSQTETLLKELQVERKERQQEFEFMKTYLEDSKKQKEDFLDIMRQVLLEKKKD